MADPGQNFSPPEIEPREFTAARMFKRPALLWCVGFLAVIPILIWSNSLVQRLSPSEMTLAAGSMALFALAPIVVFRWRLRVDEQGIWRRRFLRWDLWPWQAFADDSIRMGDSDFAFYWPEKPWGLRNFWPGLMDTEGCRFVRNVLEPIWNPPHRDSPPEEISFRVLLTTYSFNQHGLELRRRGRTSAWSWSELERVEVHRWSHEYDGLRALNVTTPEKSFLIPFREVTFQNCTRGEGVDLIGRWIHQAVPPDRLIFVAWVGPPQTAEEAEIRAARKRKDARELRLCLTIILVIAFPGLVWMIWEAAHKPPVDRPFALLAAGFMALLFVAISLAPFALPKEANESTGIQQPPTEGDTLK